MFAAALSAAAMTACSTDATEEAVAPELEGKTVEVTVNLGDATRADFTDGEGIKWSLGDKIRYVSVTNSATTEFILDETMLSEDGLSATLSLTINDPSSDATGFFLYRWHQDNEFAMTNSDASNANRTQSEAGVMNTDWLFLHSGLDLVTIPANTEQLELQMEIVGTIFRVIPYTSEYNNEKILSIKMSSNSDMVGTVRYWRVVAEPYYEAPLWGNAKYLNITLDTPFSLEGVTSAETSKGIYFPVSATKEGAPLNGYQYVVTTDQATYTFNAMDKELIVKDNMVKNVFLNLEKATERIEGVPTKILTSVQSTPNVNIDPAGATNEPIVGGYISFKVDGVGLVQGGELENFLLGDCMKIYCNVMGTGAAEVGTPAEWLNVYYRTDGEKITWDDLWYDAEPNNTSTTRRALVCFVFTAPEGYELAEGSQSYWQFEVTQEPSGEGGIGGDDEEEEGVSYTLHSQVLENNFLSYFSTSEKTDHLFRMEDITINGKTYLPGTDITNLAEDEELTTLLIQTAFEFAELTEEDLFDVSHPLTSNPESFATIIPWTDGGAAIYFACKLTQNDTGEIRTVKVVGKNADGSVLSSVRFFQTF